MFGINAIISVQASYLLYVNAMGVLTCDNVIDVPLCFAIKKRNKVDNNTYTVLPVIEVVKPVSMSEFKIITNEGITVEPFTLEADSDNNPYSEPRTFFVLPRDATGIKSVIAKTKSNSYKTSLKFGIMPPPYVYDTALDSPISYVITYQRNQINTLFKNVASLDGRINDLENKTNGLKVVVSADNNIFSTKKLPKNSGKQTINIEDGALYFEADFNYGSSPSVGHSPRITVVDDASTVTYTLALNKSVSVTIDLLAATITAYVGSTGEIVKQLKIFNTIVGYESIAFEDFDDILDDTLTVIITGRNVE